jgi:hypothetical protein
VAAHIASDVRSHLGDTNARGKSPAGIASMIAKRAERNKTLVSRAFLPYAAASGGLLSSWDFGMAEAEYNLFFPGRADDWRGR